MNHPPGSHAACTIIARNYLAHARSLAQSYLRHEPGGRFYLLVVDGLPDAAEVEPGVVVLGIPDLGIPRVQELCFKYDVTELCTAVKPSLLALILDKHGEESVLYFDPDIVIFRRLTELWDRLASAAIVLIPHLLEPIPLDGKRPSEQDILAAGAYNLGFIGVRGSPETSAFLKWWARRLRDLCRVDLAQGLFVDQKWIDLVPGLFPGTAILHEPTYDVAYWNLHGRRLEQADGDFLVTGRPLSFYHFSGYNPAAPRALSRHQNRIKVEGALAQLLDLYADLLANNGFAVASAWPYGYAQFDNGIAITPVLRDLYKTLDEHRRERFGDPFKAGNARSFLAWAVTSPPLGGGPSRFLKHLVAQRPDLLQAFPDWNGLDRGQFEVWARTTGAREMGFDPRLVDGAAYRAPRTGRSAPSGDTRPQVSGIFDPKPSSLPSNRLLGVNVCGYLGSETGIGAVARGYIRALQARAIPTAFRDVSDLSVARSKDPIRYIPDQFQPYSTNLLCVNADEHFTISSHLGEDFFQDRYNIGVWFWELPRFPSKWLDRFDQYDEVWAASSFVASTLSAVSPVPVVRIPPVLTSHVAGQRDRGRQRLGVRPDEFVYLFVFDFHSYFERKNPLALVEAFRAAYSPGDPIRLVIKTVNSSTYPAEMASLEARARNLPVSLYTDYWSAEETADLMAACDAYVSLHRSEGLGLTLAEAMLHGKPVIATDWGGNTELTDVSNSFPVPYQLVEIAETVGPYAAGGTWADPSIEDAARLMRLVREDPELASRRALAGKRNIEEHFSPEAVGLAIEERLEVIARRRAGLTAAGDRAGDPSRTGQQTGFLSRRAPGVPPIDLTTSIYGPAGRVAKRVVSLLLSYHSQYQGRLNASFAEFMKDLAVNQDGQAQRLGLLASDVQELERRLADLSLPTASESESRPHP